LMGRLVSPDRIPMIGDRVHVRYDHGPEVTILYFVVGGS
jgi:hypothetical protein